MEHISDDDLILHYYSELDANLHLDSCPHCRERYRALQSSLKSLSSYEPPAPPADLATRAWRYVAAAEKIAPTRRLAPWRWFLWPSLAAACLAVAFLAGRFTGSPGGVNAIAYLPQDEIRWAETADHFERGKLVLLETVHANESVAATVALPRERAEDLLSKNRLLRQSARARGDLALAEMLDELERILIEIARSPNGSDPLLRDSLRRRIQDQGVLFRLAVMERQTENRIEKPTQPEVTE
jgi:hypothetical protein